MRCFCCTDWYVAKIISKTWEKQKKEGFRMFITLEQIRAARALLRWTQKDLAAHAGINDDQVHNFEGGRSRSLDVLEAMYQAFVTNGIEFTDGEGVKKKTDGIKVLEGRYGFIRFLDDVYETMKVHGGEINVTDVADEEFVKYAGDYDETHVKRMHTLGNFISRSLSAEKDYVKRVDYSEYRWLPKEEFGPVPFYQYAHKLAMIIFEEPYAKVFVLESPKIAGSFRMKFMAMWERAQIPSSGGDHA
jgi:transcriptional regulator with XRE-family HTH domain